MDQGRDEREAGPVVVVGEVHTLRAFRRGTIDQGDGGAVLAFDVQAAAIPPEYSTAPVDGIWAVTLHETGEHAVAFHAARMATRDGRGGKAQLRLAVLASDLPPDRLYGRRDGDALLEIAMTSGTSERSKALDRAERLRIMRNCFIHTGEPEFLAFLEGMAAVRGLPAQGGRGPAPDPELEPSVEDRTTQLVYLLARIHSRQEVLESAGAAISVDELLRAYRTHLWNRKGKDPGRTVGGTRA